MTVPRFWRKIPARYNLIGSKCKECNRIEFPPRHVCPECKSMEREDIKLNGSGKIVTYTVIRVPPPGFESEVPYVIAIVELEEGPRLTTQIVDCNPEDVSIDKKVKLCFRKISQEGEHGVIYYGYKFKLAE